MRENRQDTAQFGNEKRKREVKTTYVVAHDRVHFLRGPQGIEESVVEKFVLM